MREKNELPVFVFVGFFFSCLCFLWIGNSWKATANGCFQVKNMPFWWLMIVILKFMSNFYWFIRQFLFAFHINIVTFNIYLFIFRVRNGIFLDHNSLHFASFCSNLLILLLYFVSISCEKLTQSICFFSFLGFTSKLVKYFLHFSE